MHKHFAYLKVCTTDSHFIFIAAAAADDDDAPRLNRVLEWCFQIRSDLIQSNPNLIQSDPNLLLRLLPLLLLLLQLLLHHNGWSFFVKIHGVSVQN